MSDLAKTNLEPIDEGEINLKEKFLGGADKEKIKIKEPAEKEVTTVPEKVMEKVEKQERVAEKEENYAKILSKVTTPQPIVIQDEEVKSDAENVNQEMDAESKINNLVNIATTKSIAHAVKVARHLEDNYVLDEFHSRLLSTELHDALVKKGLIHPM